MLIIPVNTMALVKTTRLIKQEGKYEIEVPEDFVTKIDWRNGHVLEINLQGEKLVIEKLHCFMGA
jgi:hypothetical protein